jgi:cell division septation protein DedD
MTDRYENSGKHSFITLAAIILGGLLFGAGVMVGKQLSSKQEPNSGDQLAKIDQRDGKPAEIKSDELSFHETLAEPIEPKKERVASKRENETDKTIYNIQVASFKEENQAKNLQDKLTIKNYKNVKMTIGEVAGRGTYYRVKIGPVIGNDVAKKLLERLKNEEGISAMIVAEK